MGDEARDRNFSPGNIGVPLEFILWRGGGWRTIQSLNSKDDFCHAAPGEAGHARSLLENSRQ
jgi:hypothetical protein